ncbi:MAG: class I SAM-dependent methyltransferase [Rhodospirillales bacterium]|nr:class I SAM-dependent methyltransferase [Rhodospirillales bacterium]
MIEGKQWLDFGCGDGALLEMLGSRAQEAWGVEPNSRHLNTADGGCVQIVPSLDELSSKCFDIITLFHVYEHLAEPVKMAETLKSLLNDGGTLLIEVPHARDVLLETFDSAGFRRFTLWSEHLVLHTRESLEKFLRAAGFDDVSIFGFQRFPLSNHLYWLRNNEPGGHEKWDFLDTPELSAAYFEALEKVDQTDSLIAIARS